MHWWMDKQNVVYPYNAMLFSDKKELSRTWNNFKDAMFSERSQV